MYYFQIDRKGQQSLGFIVNQSPNTQKAAQGRWSLDCISLTCTADERPQKAAVLLRGNTTHWEKLGKTRADRYKAWLSWTFPFYFKVSYSQGVTGKKKKNWAHSSSSFSQNIAFPENPTIIQRNTCKKKWSGQIVLAMAILGTSRM
jgi:hypothetical protein